MFSVICFILFCCVHFLDAKKSDAKKSDAKIFGAKKLNTPIPVDIRSGSHQKEDVYRCRNYGAR